jgi:hypothetical protein
VTDAAICERAAGTLQLCHAMLNVRGKNAHAHHPRDAHGYNHRNDASPGPGPMAARVKEVVALLQEHPLLSGIESR